MSLISPEEQGLYGPYGWTAAGVVQLLRGYQEQREGLNYPDIFHFVGLDPAAAARLRELLPEAQLEDRQNNGPSLGAVLNAATQDGSMVKLAGYVITPGRRDERVTVDALAVYDADLLRDYQVDPSHDDGCQCRELWQAIATRYSLDAETMPDELRRVDDNGITGWWLWWD